MAKALALTPDTMAAPQITPKAATPPRSPVVPKHTPAAEPAADAKADTVPLQVRVSRDEARAFKIAAAERDMKLNEFMLACFHAYMKNNKHVAAE